MNIMKSPLRYPGGKTRACKILDEYVPKKSIMLSPFFGGGSFELHRGGQWYANDLFEPVYAFWSMLKERPHELIEQVKTLKPLTKEHFYTIRKSISQRDHLRMAAEFFAINRCSFSGATFCGGFSQQSADGRFTESSIERMSKVALDSFIFTNMDAVEFLKEHPETDETWIYADPPYAIDSYIYGQNGDLHIDFDHVRFAEYIKTRRDWTLSYNDCQFIRDLYSDCEIIQASWAYGMNALKKSSELIIRSK